TTQNYPAAPLARPSFAAEATGLRSRPGAFFSHISNFNSEEVEVSDQHCHVTPDNYKNTFFLL
ncbi:hypothetical protein, partial [Enterobacter hormaechei]|uniref:hypothetical protein n=1 Tax=Enterobacter hormaechei TaxID=158836 RepID=UPI0023E307D8